MKKINNMLKKIFNNKLYSRLIIVFSIVFALCIEILVGTNLFRTTGYEKNINNQEIIKSLSKEKYVIKINDIQRYIKEIKIDIDYDAKRNIPYKVLYSNDKNKYTKIKKEYLNYVQYNKPTIRIGKYVKNIKIIFNKDETANIKINSVTLINKYNFNFIRFFVFTIIIYLILDLLKLVYSGRKIKPHIYYLKISILIGIVFSIINPMYYSLDEKEHFVRAYNMSYLNFFQEENETTLWPIDYNSIIDNPYDIYFPTTYDGFIDNFKYMNKLASSRKEYLIHNSTASPYLFPSYLISSTGILFGRIFRFSLPMQFYFGRLFNVIFCSIILSLAIKYSGKYYKLFFAMSMIPLVIFQNASFSADAVTNVFSILALSLTLYYRNRKEDISIKNIAILLLVYLLSFSSKIAYFPIGILILLIPNKKFHNKKTAYASKLFVLLCCCILFFVGTMYANNIGIVQWHYPGVDSEQQIKFLIKRPYMFPIAVFNTLNNNLFSQLKIMVTLGYNGSLGDISLLLILLVFAICIGTTEESNKIKKLDKLYIFLYIILALFASMGALYVSFTKVGFNQVQGYQGRYLIPIILPTLLIFVTEKFKINLKDETVIKIISTILVTYNIISMLLIINKFYF